MDPELLEAFHRLEAQLTSLNDSLKTLIALERDRHRPRVLRIRNTVAGQLGQVTPGETTYEGSEAEHLLKSFDTDNLLPLKNMPPWTHMARGQGSWWLVELAGTGF